jgi:drug/metabolite transporter (DMT)-like permease
MKIWQFEFVLLAAIWGASFLFMRLGAAEFGPLATAFVRVLLASACLLPLLLWRGQFAALRTHYKAIFFVGAINSGIPFVLFAYAVLSISTGLSSILNATTPLFGALVAALWLKDKPNAARTLGLALGFAGVVALASGKASFTTAADGSNSGLAVLACLGATLCYAIAGSFTKKFLIGVPPLATATGSQIGATLVLALPALWARPTVMPSATAWVAVALLAVFCSAFAYVLFFRLIERAGPARALAVTFLIPVFGLAYGALFLRETITPWMVGCGAVVILGTALATGLLKLGKAQ